MDSVGKSRREKDERNNLAQPICEKRRVFSQIFFPDQQMPNLLNAMRHQPIYAHWDCLQVSWIFACPTLAPMM